jgi:cell division protein FtsQ
MTQLGVDLQQTAAPTARRRRSPRSDLPRPRPALGRVLSGLLALLEAVLLAWLVTGPALPVRSVEVSGLSHLSRPQVLAAAGLEGRVSMLAVDGDGIRRKLERLAWVRTASARPLLPDRVVIEVQEWVPVALYDGYLLNDQAAAMSPGDPAPGLVVIQGPAAPARPGEHPLDAQLLNALVRIQAAFPTLYPGQKAAAFQLDCLGELTLTTASGVRVIFGRVITPDEFATLQPKVSALKSVAADSEVQHGQVDYINLENPDQVAVHFKGEKAPAASPAPRTPGSLVPSPSPSPAAIAPVPVIACK